MKTPAFFAPSAAAVASSPSGTRHLIVPVFKSYATIADQGGPIT